MNALQNTLEDQSWQDNDTCQRIGMSCNDNELVNVLMSTGIFEIGHGVNNNGNTYVTSCDTVIACHCI